MTEPLSEKILQEIDLSRELYFRILLVIAPTGGGKTKALNRVQKQTGAPLINVNLELSRRMLELTKRQRALKLPRLLQDIVSSESDETILFDNIEILFHRDLEQDPLKLLQGISRIKTIVSTWNGSVVDGFLTYADSAHPEYQRYPMRDFIGISPETIM